MSDYMTGVLVIVGEISLVLLVVVVVAGFIMIRRHKRNRRMALQLVEKLKEAEPQRKQKLIELLSETFEMEQEQAEAKAKGLLQCEKGLYSHVLRLFMGREPEHILHFDDDVERLVKGYRHLLEQGEEDDTQGDARESLIVQLRKENKSLREEKSKLQSDLKSSMDTLENMMEEYTSMYEGGHKEGEQRMKNEMFKLQQKISNAVSEEESDTQEGDEIPELDQQFEQPDKTE